MLTSRKSFTYKIFTAFIVVMLALVAFPVSPARAAGPTRFYLQNVASAVTTTNHGTWNYTTGAPTLVMSRTKSGSLTSLGIAETSGTNNWDVLILKFVGEPIPAQTIAAGSTLTWAIGSQESNGFANDFFHVHAYVVSNDGTTLRGTLLNNYVDGTEWSTTAQGDAPDSAQSLSAVNAQTNDRIVIEIGYQAQNASATSRTGTLWYGGTGGDLTAGGNETTLTGWFEFSQDLFPLNTTTAGTATATATSSTSIAVSMPYVDDGNGNNTYTVDYKLSSSGSWTNWVTAAAHTTSPYSTTITGLSAGTTYDVRVTYNDADGVTGTNPQIISGITTDLLSSNWTNIYSGTGTTVAGTVSATSSSTCTAGGGTNRALLVVFSATAAQGGNSDFSMSNPTVSFGAEPVVEITSTKATANIRPHAWIGYVKDANIPAGAQSVSISFTKSGTHNSAVANIKIFCATYEGVDQTNIYSFAIAGPNTAFQMDSPNVSMNIGANEQAVLFAPASSNVTVSSYTPTSYSSVLFTNANNYSVDISQRTIPLSAVTAENTLVTWSATGRSSVLDVSLKRAATKTTPTITFGAAPTPTYLGADFTVSATTTNTDSSTLTYSYVSGPCSFVSGATFHSTGAGACVVQADGAATTNFNAASQQQTVTIAQATPTITFGAAPTPTYLGADFTVSASTTNTDSSALTYSYVSGPCSFVSGATFHSTGAGACVVQADGAATTNFNAASQQQTVTIAQATPTITWATPTDISYGTTLGATQLNASTSVAGNFTYTPPSGTVLNAGNGQTLSVDFTSTDPNYKDVPGTTVSINVLKAALTVTASSSSMIFGGPVPTITPIYAGLQGSDTAPSTPPTCSTTATNVSPAGSSYPSTCSGAADPNYSISYVDGSVTVVAAGQTINVTTHAPSSAIPGATFSVAANATSSLSVAITTSGACSGSGTDSATIQMSNTVGTCTVHYNQTGNTDYSAAPEVTEDVSTMAITSANNTTFTVGIVGSFIVTTNGTPAPALTETGTLPAWLIFTDNSDGTATLAGTPSSGSAGAYPFIFKASNGVATDVTQNFTLNVAGGPTILTNGINTFNDTGDGHLDENEVVTIQLNKFTVKFSKDVIHVPSTDANYGESVINPANFMLVNDNGNGFQTVDCKTGVDPQDFKINVDSVTYNNNSGAGPFLATLSVNSGNPLANGNYRLYVCGTTSITDLGGLKLAGNGTLEGTDFIRNFSVNRARSGGGGNNGGGTSSGGINVNTAGLIPVTGFAPGQSTLLPTQPASSAYSSYNGLWIEIPSLGVNTMIMGVDYKNNSWDLTWLGNNVGYLDGSAYPTWSGNSILTGHVVEANGAPGPFAYIKDLQIGDKVNIHFGGQVFIYEVRENQQVAPTMLSTIFKHETYNWLTLVTCEDYNNITKTYNYRRYARAVLVSVVLEK